jgi:hypothetical protein
MLYGLGITLEHIALYDNGKYACIQDDRTSYLYAVNLA